MDNYNGEKYLLKIFNKLYMSDEVQHTKENNDKKHESVRRYLERLERIHSKADTEHQKSLLYNLYYDRYVIKKVNIPFGLDEKSIINEQKKSLKMWIDYLGSETTSYPIWVKYWAFQGMLKMGSYDESKEVYLTRNKKTLAPFVSANPEIIAKTIDTMMKLVSREKIDVEGFTKNDSFSRIYSFYEKEYKKNIVEKSDSTDGIWIKYNQGIKEDAIKLSKSLEKKNTSWCTASEDMSIKQLCGPYNDAPDGGDFYVYYTKDKNGNYIIPRIAIRLINKNQIAEIRGIEEAQNLEEIMFEPLESKLKEMTFLKQEDVEDNLKVLYDLKELVLISKKVEKKIELTDQELINIYTKHYGFGWEQDPKVDKILQKRNPIDDYNKSTSNEVKKRIILLEKIPFDYVTDKKLMLEVIKQDAHNIMNDESRELRYEREEALHYASEELRKDKELVLEAVKQDGNELLYVSKELWKDKEVVLAAVKNEGTVLEIICDNNYNEDGTLNEEKEKNSMCNDREVVLAAVRQNGKALQFASEELRKDKEIALEAVKQNDSALKYVSNELMDDEEFLMEISNLRDLTYLERGGKYL